MAMHISGTITAKTLDGGGWCKDAGVDVGVDVDVNAGAGTSAGAGFPYLLQSVMPTEETRKRENQNAA